MALTQFTAGATGTWQIDRILAVTGSTLALAGRLEVSALPPTARPDAVWMLSGATSYKRYTERAEQAALDAAQPALGRPEARCAALIPIRKTARWWDLPQDERRAVFEETSHHIAVGLEYLPAIARQLYHSRDLGGPFDFLTWFEYAAGDASAFEELLARLRTSREWDYVEREVDIRISR
ncbi:chlorite dismutase family protein [Cryobacterium breve]|jgi:chlorite dismutase|uniref:hydrogen peroxide-dependent heme synthase n=1 Tax=Cryobacterium breve TaxID=1259258 RepID=A0ABY7NCK3_9MICO|nr:MULTISPECIES: chlorite dismutase family protein [Cryobacterium]MDY7543753.1 chlorite dismutase family protein [Cryobacterium sp. 5B3]MEA9997559.1 chlorite dismutase family protein [Cryobacterium sp. RTS3]MEB0264276.1 chlorite dismutase family protein [Cryobacterium sp. 10I5]MEB0273458.1 chlorite dismutase family protein [Cryobacterium sp. 5B3]WBM80239.1 chlorite dismutase family protein [Cryobacterium breve]